MRLTVNTRTKPLQSCSPCGMNYDYVTKQESSEGDSNYVFEKAELADITWLPAQYSNSPLLSNPIEEWYANVTDVTLKEIYRAYYADFLLFDYDIDFLLER